MDTQTFTLLASIVSITNGLLSINVNLKKTKLVGAIKIISIYILPILFIRQIFEITYLYKNDILNILFILTVLGIIYLCYNYYVPDEFDENCKILQFLRFNGKGTATIIVLLLSMCVNSLSEQFLLNLIIEDFTSNREIFIDKLMQYHLSVNMFVYFSDNILITLSIIIDIANIVIIFSTILNTYKYFKKTIYCQQSKKSLHIGNIETEQLDKYEIFLYCIGEKNLKLSILSLFISTGIPIYLLNQILNSI